MSNTLSSDELIEEEFLKSASVDFICNWLKDNSYQEISEYSDPFGNLREKYEPVWLQSKNDKLKISVCLYGRNYKTLKGILKSSLPMHFKEALTRNNALMEGAGLYDALEEYYLSQQDMIDLYNESGDKNQLFFSLFSHNNGIEEDFLTNLFKREKPFDQIPPLALLKIFLGLFGHNRRFFSGNSKKYENSALLSDAKRLANVMVQAIPTILDASSPSNLPKSLSKSPKFLSFEALYSIKNFLEDTAEFKTAGITDQETLALFNVRDKNVSPDNHDEYEEELLHFIQRELASRGISKSFNKPDKVLEFSQSENRLIRGAYYLNAPLSMIYGLEERKLDSFFEESTRCSLDWAFWEDSGSAEDFEKPSHLSEETEGVINKIVSLLKKDPVVFTAGMAGNSKHYRSKSARKFLRYICVMGDNFGSTLPWPLGNGTLIELYEASCDKFLLESPEYFKDDSSEIILLEKISNLQKEIEHVSSSIQKHQESQSVMIEDLERKLEGIEAAQKDFHDQFSKIRSQILNFEKFIEKQIKEPKDVISRILFGIPILGRILRLIFK